MQTQVLFVVLFALLSLTLAAQLSCDSLLVPIISNFIVVGSGSTGSIVAARLAKETSYTVLLLEGGAIGTGQAGIGGIDYVVTEFVPDLLTGKLKLGQPFTRYDIPSMASSIRTASELLDTQWNIASVGDFQPQYKIIGGNGVGNDGDWLIPQKYDFDAWGISGFNATTFWPYFQRIENATSLGYPGRGSSGPLTVEIPSFLSLEQAQFANAAAAAGYSNGGDMNNGDRQEGYYNIQRSQKNGIRESTSVKYLAKVLSRSNLNFVTGATVTKVLFDIFNNAIGVEYDCNGITRQVLALQEVILAAGTLQTPKILYNSGIGPASILTAFGKPHRVVNEIIGQKIRDHQLSTMKFFDPTLPNCPANSVEFGTAPVSKNNIFLAHRVSNDAPYPEVAIDISAGGQSLTVSSSQQDIEVSVYLNPGLYANGTLNLTSSDPLAATIYTSNAFVVQEDAELIAEGILEARKIMSYWNSSLIEIAPGTNFTTVEDLIPWIKANPSTAGNYYSSVPIGTDPSAPCDSRMRVRGVQKLRVVGPASIPGPVSIGMQALAAALGEKATDIIKADYRLY